MMQALEESARRHHPSAGPMHVLLAILTEERPSTAQDVLRSLALDRERIEGGLDRTYDVVEESSGKRVAASEPLWHEIVGFAEGFAAASGQDPSTPEHILLGLLWLREGLWFGEFLGSVGTNREAVVAGLLESGVAVPIASLPEVSEPMAQAAEFPSGRLVELVRALRQREPGSRWGIKGDESEATMTVLAADNVDLAAALDSVLGRTEWRWVVPQG